LKITNVKLIKTIYDENHFPSDLPAEIAFAGRSNVGKSSLLNALFNQRIAKVSSQPGKTRSINYFSVNSDEYMFVDLPGYGFAKVSKTEKEKWGKLMTSYFTGRENLLMVFLLIDHRHEPQKNDIAMIEWLKSLKIPFSIILTKKDKLTKNEQKKMFDIITENIGYYGEYNYFPVSSEKREGLEELKDFIDLLYGKSSR